MGSRLVGFDPPELGPNETQSWGDSNSECRLDLVTQPAAASWPNKTSQPTRHLKYRCAGISATNYPLYSSCLGLLLLYLSGKWTLLSKKLLGQGRASEHAALQNLLSKTFKETTTFPSLLNNVLKRNSFFYLSYILGFLMIMYS